MAVDAFEIYETHTQTIIAVYAKRYRCICVRELSLYMRKGDIAVYAKVKLIAVYA